MSASKSNTPTLVAYMNTLAEELPSLNEKKY